MTIKKQFILLSFCIIAIPLLCMLFILCYGYLTSSNRILLHGYRTIQKVYKHAIVDHGHNIYAVGSAYTNTIEQFWGNFCKRPIIGIYNHVEKKHLQRYFDEFAFRFNTRNVTISERFSMAILGCQKRITWNQLTK